MILIGQVRLLRRAKGTDAASSILIAGSHHRVVEECAGSVPPDAPSHHEGEGSTVCRYSHTTRKELLTN